MIAYGDNVKVFCGNSNPQFAQTVCKELGIPMGKGVVKTFSDGEVSVSLEEMDGYREAFDRLYDTIKNNDRDAMRDMMKLSSARRKTFNEGEKLI